MRLTVGFDATPAATQAAGIGRYTRQLVQALANRADQYQYRLYYCAGGHRDGWLPTLDGRFRVRPLPVSDRVLNLLWHRWRLPIPVQLATGAFDLFHSPDFTLPPTWRRPSVLTVHDLAFLRVPECAYPTLRAYLARVVPRSVQRASHVIAVSESARCDLIDLLGIDPHRVSTILEGVDTRFRPPSDPEAAWEHVRRLGIVEPYIFCVGTLEPRKNYVRLLDAYALLRSRGVHHRLVIAGGYGWMYAPIFGRLSELQLDPWVTFVRPDDISLVALYGLASAFVFPSLYEGFGIPPLEALACGAPVACSNASSLPEVVGDAALTFNPYEVEQIALAVERLLSDQELCSSLQRKGLQRASAFTWDQTAATTVEVYEKALARA